MSGPIVFDNDDYFRLDFGTDYEIVTISPPLVFNSSGDQVGVTVLEDDESYEFKIHYFSGHYGATVITIPSHTVKLKKITEPDKDTFSSNNFNIDSITSRAVPEINFDFPDTNNLINFVNGIHINVLIERAPSIELPIILDSPFPVLVKTSANIYYDSDQNKIYFIDGNNSNSNFEEWFEIIPTGPPNNILNKIYTITVGPSIYTVSPSPSSQYIYTTTSDFQPLSIINSEFSNTYVDNIWRRNTLYILCDPNPKDIYTFEVYSSDNNVTYELMNNQTYFEISPGGVLRSKGISHLDTQTFELQIIIRNSLDEIIDARFRVTCYDIFSEYYFQSYMEDISALRKININMEIPNGKEYSNGISFQGSEIRKLSEILSIILRTLTFMIQYSIYIEFKTNSSDITILGNILVYESQVEFMDFLLGKITPIPSSNTLLYSKIESVADKFYPFLKNFIKSFTINPHRGGLFTLNTEFGNLHIVK